MGYNYMKTKALFTVVETPEFIKQAEIFWDQSALKEFIDFIAKNPTAGELIPGTGGARKVRWISNSNKGKRGGARIIYYYHSIEMPIFLFTAYAKNQKANLTMNEKHALQKIIQLIVTTYTG